MEKMLQRQVTDLLKRKHLSVTDSRRKILSLFLQGREALTHGDIEHRAGEKFDRVTIYRTLQTFVEKGIVHTIPTPDNAVRYALCKECGEDHHHDEHVHFICNQCSATTCLDDVVSPAFDLPGGYQADNVQVVINGICDKCAGVS